MILSKKILFSFILISFSILSQEDELEEATIYRQIKPKHAYTIDFALPFGTSNKAFSTVMQGFMRFTGSYNFSFKNNLYIGTGINYTYFQINRFKISPQIIGGLHLTNPFVKLGFEKYYSKRVGIDFGVKEGLSMQNFHSDLLVNSLKASSNFLEPYFSFCLTGNEKTAYKWTIAYTVLGFSFNPKQIGDEVNADFEDSEFKRLTQFFSFGFSFSHHFKQRI